MDYIENIIFKILSLYLNRIGNSVVSNSSQASVGVKNYIVNYSRKELNTNCFLMTKELSLDNRSILDCNMKHYIIPLLYILLI